MVNPFVLVSPASRGLSLALTQQLLKSTKYPVYATHRSKSADEVKERILKPLGDVDEKRLHLLTLDLNHEDSIQDAAKELSQKLPKDSFLHTAFLTGGVLHPEKQPSDLSLEDITSTFHINVISHLLQIKHFSQFLPTQQHKNDLEGPAKWVHVTARVGSISDNERGGWYSYRSSKAALNQVIKTFDLQLKMKKSPAISVGVHPGTVKTDLSKGYWTSTPKDKLFEPEYAAECLVNVVMGLKEEQRGRVWDWQGKEIHP
ncbi:NAD(P)-binding protein [Sistotremastrum niveocremeum HHB9708]|uniref:NAD(P)-binding protein n=1 Tax=Sistotremastrum niveocremeum HHB9708 TaxID=1314777 RepID=A0A164Z410_9AGAM|nr:NAD(P)-binding protein [Sistotremastrum niveocremeum HHB9708]